MPSSAGLQYLNKAGRIWWWSLFLVILGFSFKVSKVDIGSLIGGLSLSLALAREMLPPDFSRWRHIVSLAAETVAMGFWGTILGMLISLPLGFLAARNTAKNWLVYQLSKGLVTLLRSIPDVIYAFFFVTAFGLGPQAGVAALTLATVGLLGKFYSEAVESIDEKPVEALIATGPSGGDLAEVEMPADQRSRRGNPSVDQGSVKAFAIQNFWASDKSIAMADHFCPARPELGVTA